jgi:hypothetical protein
MGHACAIAVSTRSSDGDIAHVQFYIHEYTLRYATSIDVVLAVSRHARGDVLRMVDRNSAATAAAAASTSADTDGRKARIETMRARHKQCVSAIERAHKSAAPPRACDFRALEECELIRRALASVK